MTQWEGKTEGIKEDTTMLTFVFFSIQGMATFTSFQVYVCLHLFIYILE